MMVPWTTGCRLQAIATAQQQRCIWRKSITSALLREGVDDLNRFNDLNSSLPPYPSEDILIYRCSKGSGNVREKEMESIAGRGITINRKGWRSSKIMYHRKESEITNYSYRDL
ncbi:hypothetical protein L1887_23994 [Cichorium endivia]|nr:hypothetical protein L1887_23994 [Cichorium endivia]